MATFTKTLLSGVAAGTGSTGGRQLKVSGTATGQSVTVHTTLANTTTVDEVWLYAYNGHTAPVVLTLEWGFTSGATPGTDDVIKLTVPNTAGLVLVVPGLPLTGSSNPTAATIKAWAGTGNVIWLSGYVNRIA